MAEQASYCPFLNRSDDRCSEHFSLENLGHAFKDCFGSYKRCAVYLDLLVERQMRRSGGREAMLAELKKAGDGEKNSTAARSFVQLSVSHPDAQRVADGAVVSAASRR